MEIAFKASFVRKEATEVRRFRGSYSWDGLTTVIAHLWGGNAPKSYSVEYTDADGDSVRIGSEMEWAECQRLFRELKSDTLKITVRRVKRDDKHIVRPATEQSSAEQPTLVESQVVALAEEPKTVVVEEVTVPALNTSACVAQPCEPALNSPGASDEEAEPVFSLLSVIFGCDAKTELLNVNSRFDFRSVARIVHQDGEVDVDLNQEKLRALSVSTANTAMDNNEYQTAINILKSASQVFSTDKVMFYNLACAFALQNLAEESIAALTKAVELGYDNVNQLTFDSDLANVRSHPQFAVIVRKLSPQPVVPEPIVVPEPVVVPVAPVAPVLMYPHEVEKLISIFPDLDVGFADDLLKAHKGNVRGAIDAMFA